MLKFVDPFRSIVVAMAFVLTMGAGYSAAGTSSTAPSDANSWIVVLDTNARGVDEVATALAEEYGLLVRETWSHALVGLWVETDSTTASHLAADPRVRYVERDVELARPIADGSYGRRLSRGKDLAGLTQSPPHCYDQKTAGLTLSPYPAGSAVVEWGEDCPEAAGCVGNWGLDRIDQRQGLDGVFSPMAAGGHEVDIFIIDSGIAGTHPEISDPWQDEFEICQSVDTCRPHPHGSHVAGIAAGNNFGVAQTQRNLFSLNLGNDPSLGKILAAFNRLIVEARPGVPTLVSISANAEVANGYQSLGEVVRKVVAVKNITVINAAGNISSELSCADIYLAEEAAGKFAMSGGLFPPEVIIVGASAIAGAGSQASDALYCDCDEPGVGATEEVDCGTRIDSQEIVDLYAPGGDIVSMFADLATGAHRNSVCHLSGTSMAAPHVAGASAILLSRFPQASPGTISKALKRMATAGAVPEVPGGRLLYIGPYPDQVPDWQPVAGDQYLIAPRGKPTTIAASELTADDIEWQGLPLSVETVTAGSGVSVFLSKDRQHVTFTVDPGTPLTGNQPSTTSFSYAVSNGINSSLGVVRILVVPSLEDDQFSFEGLAMGRIPEQVLAANDDFENRPATFAYDDSQTLGSIIIDFPFHGTRKVFYKPPSLDFTGTDQFDYIHTDPLGGELRATVTVHWTGIDVNAYPSPGLWWNPERNGNGFDFQRNDAGNYVLTWFTYKSDGTPVWYVSDTRPVVNGTWSSTLFKSTWNSASQTNTLTANGDVRFLFTGNTRGHFSWDLWFDGDVPDFDGDEAVELFHGGGSDTGLWFEPAYSGWGTTVAHQSNTPGPDSAVSVTFYEGSQPTWAQGTHFGSPSGNAFVGLNRFTGVNLCPGCQGETLLSTENIGYIVLELGAITGTARTQITLPSGLTWNRGTPTSPAAMVRLTRP